MRRDEQLERLRSVFLFENLSKREVTEIRRVAQEIEFRDGSEVVGEGSIGDDFYLILEGEARVTKGSTEVKRLAPGDYFGEIAVILGTPRSATVTALGRVLVLRLDSDRFLPLLDSMPSIARKVLVEVTRRLLECEDSRAG